MDVIASIEDLQFRRAHNHDLHKEVPIQLVNTNIYCMFIEDSEENAALSWRKFALL